VSARYTSPPGTFEPLRKELLEDPTLGDAEARLICYLVTKPDGWELKPRQLGEALGRSPYWVKTALAALRRRGLVVDGAKVHDPATGRFSQRPSRFRRDLACVPEKETRRSRQRQGIPPLGPTSPNVANGQVTPQAGIPPLGVTSPNSTFAQVTPEVESPAPGKTSSTSEDGHPSEDGKAKTVVATGGRSAVPPDPPAALSRSKTRDLDRAVNAPARDAVRNAGARESNHQAGNDEEQDQTQDQDPDPGSARAQIRALLDPYRSRAARHRVAAFRAGAEQAGYAEDLAAYTDDQLAHMAGALLPCDGRGRGRDWYAKIITDCRGVHGVAGEYGTEP
jgi:hypothetical protein